jgi:Ni/Fe-hydrogenase subunit HybB-like protein
MPIVFLMSAIVSGVALVLLLYMFTSWVRRKAIEMACLDTLAAFVLYSLILDFTLEALELVHRAYTAEEAYPIIQALMRDRLFFSMEVLQVGIGTLVPMLVLVLVSPAFLGTYILRTSAGMRRTLYAISALLIQVGIFSMRWNVVVGGQLFSKSLRGLHTYTVPWLGTQGILVAVGVLALPFIILFVLTKILPPWPEAEASVPQAH